MLTFPRGIAATSPNFLGPSDSSALKSGVKHAYSYFSEQQPYLTSCRPVCVYAITVAVTVL